jgi:hypothetical protein
MVIRTFCNEPYIPCQMQSSSIFSLQKFLIACNFVMLITFYWTTNLVGVIRTFWSEPYIPYLMEQKKKFWAYNFLLDYKLCNSH